MSRFAGNSVRVALMALLCAVALPTLASPVAAQQTAREQVLLREAVEREAAGDLEAAETMLREILDGSPASVPTLIALERVLRVQGRLEELPPTLETAMAVSPRSPYVNRLRLETYSALDQVDALERAARQWITIAPTQEVAYREVARVWEARGEVTRALSTLEEGRRVLGRPNALALELGDVLAGLGEYPAAVQAWGWAIDMDGRGLPDVLERVREHPEAGPFVAPVVDRLAGERASPARREAALALALAAGYPDRARSVAEGLVAELPLSARRRLLDHVAGQADADGHAALAYWAYGALLDVETQLRYGGEDPAGRAGQAPGRPLGQDSVAGTERLLALRTRVAELALALGDSAAAAAAFRAVEADGAGSARGRAAAALRIELTAADDPDAAVSALERFAAEHPHAPELDRLTATVAGVLLGAGRQDEAEAVLGDLPGPRSSLVRARLRLQAGDAAGARAEYMTAAPGLRGAEATHALRLVTLLGRISGHAAVRVGEALRLRDEGAAEDAARALLDAVDTGGAADGGEDMGPGAAAAADTPPLLAFAASLADADAPDLARRIRERIVADHPDAPDAPAALLALGRGLAGEESTHGEARVFLERLIIEYPESALVAQARRELDRIR